VIDDEMVLTGLVRALLDGVEALEMREMTHLARVLRDAGARYGAEAW
jgi:hypothetical protein